MSRSCTLLVAFVLSGLVAAASAADPRQPGRAGNPPGKPATQPKDKPKTPADLVLVIATDNAKTVTAAVGKTVELRLTGDRGTGNDWQLTSVSGDSLKAAGKPQFTPAPNIPGKLGGVFSFPFKAVQPGRTTIKAAFFRPGDKNAHAQHTFSVEVMVKKAT